MSDFIGDRGEALTRARLTKIVRKNDTPFFRTYRLDSKAETLDFYVELVVAGKKRPYFFVQAKATRAGYTFRNDPVRERLCVQATKAKLEKLALFPAPTYLVGIDEDLERLFIISMRKKPTRNISSITTRYELNPQNLRLLWREVRDYWRGKKMRQTSSCFDE